jgi:hypothetical protein
MTVRARGGGEGQMGEVRRELKVARGVERASGK